VRTLLTGALALLCAFTLRAQDTPDTAGIGGVNWFAYPYAFYTPETNLAFGAAGILYFRTERDRLLNPSQVLLSGYYTINDQYDVTLSPQFYFSRNRYFGSLDLGFKKVIDKFYGIGNNTEDRGTESYIANAYRAELVFQMPPALLRFMKLFGLIYRYNYYRIIDKMDNPMLQSAAVSGTEGGASSGFGIVWVVDSRDNIYSPTAGAFHQFRAVFHSRVFGGRYDFNDYRVDLRAYYAVLGESVLGFQIYGDFVRGFPPFYELARLGGSERMRGYYEGRFRDRNYVTGQVELRHKLWERIGVVAFAGTGQVGDQVKKFSLGAFKPSYGFGLRYVIDVEERINVRADFAWGTQTNGVYFGINQAF
jgi:outer membrane protein assembly factor BamA